MMKADDFLDSLGRDLRHALRGLARRPAFTFVAVLGRWFSRDDDLLDSAEAAILSDSYWQRRFGGDPNVIGRTITIDGRPREVIGVMPARFSLGGVPIDLILPLRIDLAQPSADYSYAALARLKPGVTVAQANADVARMLPIFLEKYAGHRMDSLHLEPAVRALKNDVIGNVGQVLWVLLGSISILLLIACANVANLSLVRTETRRTELAIRTALGAGAGRLARGLLVESLTLSLLGGLLGVALAYGGLQILLAFPPTNLPRLNEIEIDFPVLIFALAISVLSGLLFGAVPMLRIAGRKFASHLAQFVHGGERAASAGKRQQRSQNTLVVIQVALALVMLVGSGLMIRTFQNLRSVQPGFTDPATVEAVRISMPDAMSAKPERVPLRQRQILEQLVAIPGVASVAYIDRLPAQGGNDIIVYPRDRTYENGELPPTRRVKSISPGLLATLGTPLLAGRDFDWQEIYNQRNVALVSASFARETWNTVRGAVGKRIRVGPDGPWEEVIGVVADVYDDGPDHAPPPTVYRPARAHRLFGETTSPLSLAFVLRTDRTGTESLLQDIRHAVSKAAPDLPIAQVRTLAEVYAASMERTSFSLVLLAIAGAMALVISIVGIYGVLAYAVAQRQREVGIRIALGAAPPAIKRMFLYRGMILWCIGSRPGR
jgi:putative ABC transport system permease protein